MIKSYLKEKTLNQWFALLGVLGVIFYFMHVILGIANYPSYSSLSQAVSDLTASTAPSREIASSLSTVNAIFTAAACTVICLFFQRKESRVFRIGIYLFALMQWISAVGYTLFPLSAEGYVGELQDVMHMVVTGLVVPLSIASMILLAIGCIKNKTYKAFGIFTIVILGLMALGAIGTGIIPADYFGIAERLSVYSVVIYSGALSLFTFIYTCSKT